MTDAERQLKQLCADYAKTFKTPEGQRVLRDLMARFNISRPHLTRDALELALYEGQRATVLHIFTMLRLNETDIARLMMQQPTMFDETEDEI